MKIIYKIIVPVSIMLLLAVSAVSFIGYYNISSEIDNVMKVSTQSTLEDISFEQETIEVVTQSLKESLNNNFLRITRSIALIIKSDPKFLDTATIQDIAETVGIEEIHVADSNGILFAGSVPGFFGFDFSQGEQGRPFLQLIDKNNAEFVQEPTMRDADEALFQYIGVSLGKGDGFIQVGVKPQELQDLLEISNLQYIIENYNYKQGAYSYVIDPETKVCTHHVNKDLIGFDMSTVEFTKPFFENQSGDFTYIWEGVEFYTSFTTTNAGIIAATVPTESHRQALEPILSALIITSLLALIILIIISALIVRKIIKPLHQVNETLMNISTGNADLTRRIGISSTDEIGDVAKNFNAFIEKLQQLISDIQEAVIQTGQIKNKIITGTETTARSIEEINQTILNVEAKLNAMNEKINDNASAMVQITSNTQSFDNVISNQAAMVEESTASITEMIASLNSVGNITKAKKESTNALKNIAEEGKKQIDETSNDFETVVDKVSNIQEMADTINGMASQTNLLSMNAAIEAAHAGEAGKGFAVVAEEIRKLAETSAVSSAAISKQLLAITEGINNTSKNMGTTLKTFDSIAIEVESTVNAFMEIESSVSELTIGGQQIMSSTEEINNVTVEVRTGSAEIHKGIDSSNNALFEIKDNSSEVSSGVGQIFNNSSVVTGAITNLKTIGNDLNEITSDLSEKFSQFITK